MAIATERKQTLSQRLNWRIVVFVLLILGIPGWIAYSMVKLSLTSGIEQVGDHKWVDLKAMGNFPFDDSVGTEADVPAVYRKLDGAKVVFDGQMYVDYTSAPRVERFQLVYSIANCCFNGPPRVQERVFAHAKPGELVTVCGGLARVYGTLHIRAQKENGRVVSVFDMDVDKAEPL